MKNVHSSKKIYSEGDEGQRADGTIRGSGIPLEGRQRTNRDDNRLHEENDGAYPRVFRRV